MSSFRYQHALGDLPQASWGLHTDWLSCFLVDEQRFGCTRDRLIAHLDAAGIEARPVWKPMHLQPLYGACATAAR